MNEIKKTLEEPVSTFSVDVDTSSYSYVRKLLKNWQFPSPESIKIEEFINYFDYDYPTPSSKGVPFESTVAISDSPWNTGRKLMHIGVKGYDVDPVNRPHGNIVFLVDVSGSMAGPERLPLAKEAIEMLVGTMLPYDLVSIVTYASNVNIALPPTWAKEKGQILEGLQSLRAGGATWGTGGIEQAYELAEQNFDEDAVNRIILLTDGDFNIGLVDESSLEKYIASKRDTGIYLSVLGFGMGNYHDTTMKALANHGNGVAAYIDGLEEASKVMVTEASSTVFPIAKDVKIQVEFNPAMVAEYRLIGYEKRLLRREDFNNDKVDGGDIGSGHTVTAIYEITPVDSTEAMVMDDLRYSHLGTAADDGQGEGQGGKGDGGDDDKFGDEYAYLKMRYKLPEEDASSLLSKPITKEDVATELADEELFGEFRFATAVASFAQALKGRPETAMSYETILELAEANIGEDRYGYRKEFINLVRTVKRMVQESQNGMLMSQVRG